MHTGTEKPTETKLVKLRAQFAHVPTMGWLFGCAVAVLLEHGVGSYLIKALYLPKIPVLFGFMTMLKKPLLIPSSMVYVGLIYVLPVMLVAKFTQGAANKFAGALLKLPGWISPIVHIAILYAVLHFWGEISAFRVITVKLTMIAVMMTLSLNVINGYMGEFSCSHPGFMALGAYGASVFTVVLFANDKLFGTALLPGFLGPFMFPLGLIFGGFVAALGALVIAIPSFRTRGDYLAIISLAFMFIVKSLVENMEMLGGPRGMMGQPDWANLPTVFLWMVLCIWVINNFVRSTMGKALNAVRDDEMAANAMTVNTRKTKMVGFMFAAFWAGVSGGLYAHVIRYISPGDFDLKRLAEVLAMVYFGGLNSVYGSIVGAVSLSLLSEMLKPLALFKWIIIPLLLILVMIFRPKGLISFKEFSIRKLVQPKA